MPQDRGRNHQDAHYDLPYGNGRNGRRSPQMVSSSSVRGDARVIREMNRPPRRDTEAPPRARTNHSEQPATRRATRGGTNKEAPGQRSLMGNADSRTVSAMSPEATMRRRIRIVYLTLLVVSVAVIILFAVLLKGKLRAIKTNPTDANAHHQFEEHPRVTMPTTDNLVEDGEGEGTA